MPVIISGLSGAGKSTALHALEDMGCFCTDNLPLEMLSQWADMMQKRRKPIAVCIDTRSASPSKLHEVLKTALADRQNWQLIYLDASGEALLRRFSTLRRRHPFAPEQDLPQAIAAEREALVELRGLADLVLDTSKLNPYELADLVETYWRQRQNSQEIEMMVSLISFSYQRGLPLDADMVIDLRFLPNPHYQPELAALSGKDEPVQAFLESQADVADAEARLQDWFLFLWPRLKQERKQYLTVAFGCSGGRHRSVYMAERLAAWIRDQDLAEPLVRHRELPS